MELEEIDSAIPMTELKLTTEKQPEVSNEVPRKKKHRDELEDLRQSDPDFFEYLKKNDASLLSFEDDLEDAEEDELNDLEGDELMGESEEEDDDDEGDGEGDGENTRRKKGPKPTIETTEEVVKEIITSTANGSMTALKKLLYIFRATCLPSADKDIAGETPWDQSNSRYIITNPEVYEYIMIEVLENLYKGIYKHLDLPVDRPVSSLSRQEISHLEEHRNWKKNTIIYFIIL